MPSLLGIDNGLTVTKAVVFDIDGTPLSVARRRVPQLMPQPRHVERDMDGLWLATAEAIAEAIAGSRRPANDVVAIAATAHGDGIYLLDADERPLGPGILSLDSRAGTIADDWAAGLVAQQALALTGQMPHTSAPSALLAWIKIHEPERYARIAHILSCKDWLRYCLTGAIGTDRTEASTSFTSVADQTFSIDAMRLFGLEKLYSALPAVAGSAEIVGLVSAAAAKLTGLTEGTPVAAGLHDVTASALGIGGHKPGVVAIVAGTYSINEVVSDRPKVDPRWFCRNAIEPGQWNNMAISPASAANYDWFLDTLCQAEHQKAEASGQSVHALLGPEIDAALTRPSTAIFHPYLFGSPYGSAASASFLGLRGWQDRGDMLRAVLEGIAFNHRVHIDALRDGFDVREARLTGGASRNPAFAQMFADILAMPVTVTATEEAAAWGAALCAGAGISIFASPNDDPRNLDGMQQTYRPDTDRSTAYQTRYELFRDIANALQPLWPRIDGLTIEGDAP
ncbi:carbohydrate kinase [Rhizobium sp. TH2]|uniref:FGGY-family carbohydrate kinase n=1 Tax=Rhizobium sp. TH2 TaxID=2775403 RepID=UPI002157ACF7|nr:FGGY-family carbohydrate kinase [Rhizobium sp. TH2]UVC07465.1 carbohydrate kinase [Rhizobium sp. TH2]